MNEIKIERNELLKRLKVVSGSAVMLRANEKDISVLTNDNETFVRAGFVNDKDEEICIEAAVNYRTLLETVKSFGDIIAIRKTTTNLILASGKDRAYIKINEEVNPEPPSGGNIIGSFHVNPELWKNAISRTSFAAAIEDSNRIILTGIHVRVENDAAIIEAVDGINAARTYVPVQSVMLSDPEQNIDFVYPAITAKKLARTTKSDQDEMLVRVFSHSIDFKVGDVFAATLLLKTTVDYPKLDMFFQSPVKQEIVVTRKRLSAALNRALLLDDAGYIKISAIGEIIVGSSNTSDIINTIGSTSETIPAVVNTVVEAETVVNTAEAYLIWFNFDRLNNIIENVRGDMIKIECNEPNAPARIYEAGKKVPFTAVIMPVIV